jgi:thiosulfate/3-mercaptopyruvate sulfurtransferase
MPYTTLISPSELSPHLDEAEWAVVDCRFSLKDVEQGRRSYEAGHIAGAVYANLDEDLSGPIVAGKTGRHPLPDAEVFTRSLCDWGIDDSVQVVVYDDAGGAIAGRLWWMLRWMGHDSVAVLDGGWPHWESEGLAVRAGSEARDSRNFVSRVRHELLVDAQEVVRIMNDASYVLYDARGEDRYRGKNETLDPVPGHIPGAVSLPFTGNLDGAGRFQSRENLHARFQPRLNSVPAERTVMYCGSGVTAAHNVLAMVHAGLDEPRLYVGSWSDWITDSNRPVESG